MECLICGKQYISVGVHARHKHGITPEEYRAEFGLMKTAPLVDNDLSDHLSKMRSLHYKNDPEAKAQAAEQCRDNLAAMTRTNTDMSAAGRAKLGQRNTLRNQAYLATRAAEIGELMRQKKPLTDIQRITGVAPITIRGMIKAGMVPAYDRSAVATARRDRAQATTHLKRDANISKVLALYDTDLSTAAILRQTGIGSTTYKRWVSAGTIPRRATYRREDEKKAHFSKVG